jgi:catechol 2,3-dioxygenase-like lactoylglutathione lyase family enzyme
MVAIMDTTQKLSVIRQIAITVSNVDAALGFYRDILGLTFLFGAGPDLAFLDAGGIRIMLSTPQGAGAVGANSVLYFNVSEIGTTHAVLVARGATSEREPQLTAKMPDHELWIGFLRDPDGNLVGLLEERR